MGWEKTCTVGAWKLSASFGYTVVPPGFLGARKGEDRMREWKRDCEATAPSGDWVINCSNTIMSCQHHASSASLSTASNHAWQSYLKCLCAASCRAMSWVSLNSRSSSQTSLMLCQLYSAQGFCTTLRHADVCCFGSAMYAYLVNMLVLCYVWCLSSGFQLHPNN